MTDLAPELLDRIQGSLKQLQNACHANSEAKGFWAKDRAVLAAVDGGTPTDLNAHAKLLIISTKIALMHSELSEALEGMRTGNGPSDKLHEFGLTQMEEELAYVVVRAFDLSGEFGWDLGRAIIKKMGYNSKREYLHGKKF